MKNKAAEYWDILALAILFSLSVYAYYYDNAFWMNLLHEMIGAGMGLLLIIILYRRLK